MRLYEGTPYVCICINMQHKLLQIYLFVGEGHSKFTLHCILCFIWPAFYEQIYCQSLLSNCSLNPTSEGVQILWVGGGGASEAPPKKSMMEWA